MERQPRQVEIRSRPATDDTRSYEVAGKGTKAMIHQVAADGTRTTITYTATLDGKETPITGSPNFDTGAIKRINATTIEPTLKKTGKVVQTNTYVFSNSGKTITQTVQGTNASGRRAHNVLVVDRQ